MAILSGNVFNVKDLSPALWLDAADSSTLYDAVSGGNLVADGGAVARWEDKSGNGRHVTQSTLTNRPLRTVGAQNTRDVVLFNSANSQNLSIQNSFLNSLSGLSVFIVNKWSLNSSNNSGLFSYGVSQQYTNDIFYFTSSSTTRNLQINNSVDGSATYTLSAPINFITETIIFDGSQTGNSSRMKIFVNSLPITLNFGSYTVPSQTATPTNPIFMLGGYGPSVSGWFYNGSIAEVIILPYTVTNAQRQSIERYLANKWGFGFNPLSLSPVLWLDASDSSTLFDATSGGNLVAAGGTVARWEDKSGNARHVTQATLSSRPIKVEGVQGGKSVVRFDGVNDLLSTAANSPSVTGVTIYFVSKHNSFGGSNFARLLEMGSNGYIYMVNLSNAFSQQSYRGLYIAGSLLKDSASFSATTGVWRVHGISNANNSLVSQTVHRVNGVVSSGVITGDGTLTIPTNVAMHIGNRSALDRAFDGDIAEILVFPTVLTNEQNIAVERYLAQKWNIIP